MGDRLNHLGEYGDGVILSCPVFTGGGRYAWLVLLYEPNRSKPNGTMRSWRQDKRTVSALGLQLLGQVVTNDPFNVVFDLVRLSSRRCVVGGWMDGRAG